MLSLINSERRDGAQLTHGIISHSAFISLFTAHTRYTAVVAWIANVFYVIFQPLYRIDIESLEET